MMLVNINIGDLKMRNYLVIILLLITNTCFADDDFFRNDGNLDINRNDQGAGFAKVDSKGNVATEIADSTSGLSQSVVPVSQATDFNGTPGVMVGYAFIASDTVEAGSTTTVINATSHVARVGDALSFRTGTAANQNVWTIVSAVSANAITVSRALPATPAASDAFHVIRPQPASINPNNGNSVFNSLNVAISTDGQPTTATGLLKAEDAAHASGDAGVLGLAVRNDNMGTGLSGTNLDYTPHSVDSNGGLFLSYGTSNAPLKLEDAVHSSGDAGLVQLGIRNDSAVGLSGTDFDYTVPVVNQYGGQAVDLDVRFQGNGTAGRSPIRQEDAAAANSDAGVVSLFLAESALVQQVGSSVDYGVPKTDLAGRTVIAHAPSGQMVAGCNAVISTATTGTILAAVASQFTFVTSLSCTNTGGAATRVILEDGAGNDLANVMLPATTGFATVSFPSPVRTSVVNSVIQANVITTGSATICCASGYTGVI
jgi:hypothetical protein